MDWNEYFYYDETSPTCLRWKVDVYGGKNYCARNIRAGAVAGNFHSNPKKTNFQTCVKIKNKTYKLQRVVWEIFNGPIHGDMVIDHLNGDPWDNRIDNLACKTKAANCRNRKRNSNNKTGVAGVNTQGEGDREQCCGVIVLKNGKRKRKCFSVKRHGAIEAMKLASEWRALQIKEFNELNPEERYTDRHGT